MQNITRLTWEFTRKCHHLSGFFEACRILIQTTRLSRIASVIHLVPFLYRYRCSDTDMETWNTGLRPTTADADKQLLTNITYLDSFALCVPSAEHRYELHMDIKYKPLSNS